MILILRHFLVALLSATACSALVTPNSQTTGLEDLGFSLPKRADNSLTGYLGAFFLGDEPDVYFYLSEGNDPVSFTALNEGSPILVPTLGTGGVRDPAIVVGGGDEAGKKWYVVGTDLDISKVNMSPCPCPELAQAVAVKHDADLDPSRQHGTHPREQGLEGSLSGRART